MSELSVSDGVKFRDYDGRPFLKWAGGKQRQVSTLVRYAPRDFGTYFEPFIGAGSMFFALHPKAAVLSDLNQSLIETYQLIKDQPDVVYRELKTHASLDTSDHYYESRDHYNNGLVGPERAATFIYLNRAGFNGVFRVNKKGEYNVPYGQSSKPLLLPSLSSIKKLAAALKNTLILNCDFESIVEFAEPCDFVYFDPPYGASATQIPFQKYTAQRFTKKDQTRLHKAATSLRDRGVNVLMSNANVPYVRELYSEWSITNRPVSRTVNPGKVRNTFTELTISSRGSMLKEGG
jgi:DNA adenine methylase